MCVHTFRELLSMYRITITEKCEMKRNCVLCCAVLCHVLLLWEAVRISKYWLDSSEMWLWACVMFMFWCVRREGVLVQWQWQWLAMFTITIWYQIPNFSPVTKAIPFHTRFRMDYAASNWISYATHWMDGYTQIVFNWILIKIKKSSWNC